MKTTQTKSLRRYTTLPALLHILKTEQLTLLSPSSWEDYNDFIFLDNYKIIKNLKSILALCFTRKNEQFHYWKIFANSSNGVCIVFNEKKLLESIDGKKGIKYKDVSYRSINSLKDKPPTNDELPFLKRSPYRDEKEFRIIYESKNENCQFKDIDIDIKSIEKVVLSPWLPTKLKPTIRALIKKESPTKIKVPQTSILNNAKWQNFAKELVDC